MEKFKINNEIKRALSRKVKEKITGCGWKEVAIFYAVPTFNEEGRFFISESLDIDRLESEGNVFYKLFTYSEGEKLTLTEIENKIFS